MDNDNEPKETRAATNKPKQGRNTKTHNNKGPKKSDSGGSESIQADMGSHTSASN